MYDEFGPNHFIISLTNSNYNWTLAAIDGREDINLSAKTLSHCARLMATIRPFTRVILFGYGRPQNFSYEYFQIPKFDLQGYCLWSIRELWRHITTSHVLTIQPDGYILNPEKWEEEFFEYDYIGAPWTPPMVPADAQDCLVGNGGFCLRSKRFCEVVGCCPRPYRMENDDVYFCQRLRVEGYLDGMKFAPVEVARRFSLEWDDNWGYITENDVFGFHEVVGGRRVFLS